MSTKEPCEPATSEPIAPPETKTRQGGFVVMELANLPDRALIDEKTLASMFNCAERTIQAMVARYDLPPALDIAGRKLWIVGRLVAWLNDRAERLAQDAERKAERLHIRD